MDTSRWKHGEEFAVLDLVARFEFKTGSSVSFLLCKSISRHEARIPEMEPGEEKIGGLDKWDFLMESGPALIGLGWLDIHHPCEGGHPLQIRVGLPDRYVSWESIREMVPKVKEVMGLPPDEPFEGYITGLLRQLSVEEPQRGFVSTTRWKLPD
jgi:hypothetical protein